MTGDNELKNNSHLQAIAERHLDHMAQSVDKYLLSTPYVRASADFI